MKRALKSFLTFSLVVLAACAQTEGTNVEGTGGSNGSGTGGSGTGGTGTGGNATGTGGSSTGGSGTGGASPGTGGTHTGGTTGTGGTAGNIGSAGRGGTTGTGGTAGALGKGGSTGTRLGTGGTATGGAGGAHVGTGGDRRHGRLEPAAAARASLFTIMVQLASAVKSTAPTTVGIVTWSITASGITAAHIDFGLDTSYGMTAPVDLTAAMYRTLLLGMKPAKTYHFRVVASAGATTYTSDDQTVTTGAKISSTPHHQLLGQERGGRSQGLLHHLVLAGHRLQGAVHLRHRR